MKATRTRSLRFQLAAAFLLVGMTPVLLLGAIALTSTLAAMRRGVEARNQGIALAVSGEVGRYLDSHLIHLREVLLAMGANPRQPAPEIQRHLALHLQANPAIRSILLLDPDDRVLVAAPPAPDLAGTDFSGQPFVREARARREPTWSSATISIETGQPSVTLVVPGYPWSVVGFLDLAALTRIVERTGAASTTLAAVVDRDGTVIAHADPRLVRQQVNVGDLELVTQALAGKDRTGRFRLEGREWLGSAVPVTATRWAVLAMEPAEVAFAPMDDLRALLFLGFGAAAVLALGAGWVFAWRILRPVEALAASTRRVAAGERPAPHVRELLAIEEFDELGRLFDAMATAVRVREKELARSQQALIHTQKVEAVGRLAGGIAHDFNNLLTAIIGYANVMRDDLPPGHEGREALDGILQASDRAAHLTRSLLAYSRKQVLSRRPVDLREVVREAARLIGRVLGEDVRLALELPDGPLTVLADAGQIDQVLMNLCTNARDAMPSGGTLAVQVDRVVLDAAQAQARELAAGGAFVRLRVSDTGVGMTPDLIERVFEPFFTTKAAGKGTGLGLAIVQGIVRQHDGAVSVESTPGRGTTVTILLPQLPAEEARAAPPEDRLSSAPRGTETILLVEDDAQVRRVMRSILERGGYTVIEAGDGRVAVETFALHRDRIALCLLDVVMPELNGREALDAIRRIDPRARVLFASGYTGDVLAERTAGEWIPEVIGKPVAPADLLRKVREVLERPSAP